jgi:secreted trypsin-like serine protease
MMTLAVVALALAAPAAAHASASPRIVGGGPATTTNWPSTVWLLGQRDLDGDGVPDPEFSCTGSLIAPSWVLTAAHCVLIDTEYPTKGTEPVKLSDLSQRQLQRSGGQAHPGLGLIPTPTTSSARFHNDVALVHLQHAATQTPIALAQKGVTYNSPNGVVNAAGWGRIDVD